MTDETSAIVEITEAVNRYGYAVDPLQWHLFDAIFTTDCFCDYGSNSWHDLASLKQDFHSFHAAFDATQHAMTNTICKFDGDRASVMTYGHWLLIRRGLPGGDRLRATGWYHDEFRRIDGRWLIARRKTREIDWSGNREVVVTTPGASFPAPDLAPLSKEAREGRITF